MYDQIGDIIVLLFVSEQKPKSQADIVVLNVYAQLFRRNKYHNFVDMLVILTLNVYMCEQARV